MESSDPTPNQIVRQLYDDAPYKACLVLAGAGWTAITHLMAEPGASKVIWGISIPYDDGAKRAYIEAGERLPYTQVGDEMIETLMRSSIEQMGDIPQNKLNLALSAALQTNRIRKGDDHAWLGVEYINEDHRMAWDYRNHIILSKDLTRESQELVLSTMILNEMISVYREDMQHPLMVPYPEYWESTQVE